MIPVYLMNDNSKTILFYDRDKSSVLLSKSKFKCTGICIDPTNSNKK